MPKELCSFWNFLTYVQISDGQNSVKKSFKTLGTDDIKTLFRDAQDNFRDQEFPKKKY